MTDPVFLYNYQRNQPCSPLEIVNELRRRESAASTIPPVGSKIILDGPEGKHAAQVKRISVGERLVLADGIGHGARCSVGVQPSPTSLGVLVEEELPSVRRRPLVIVVQALPKSERSELAVDLATQAGADAIIPWQASRCISKWTGPKVDKGIRKWTDQAISSAKQSRRFDVPLITEPATTTQIAQLVSQLGDNALGLVLHEDPLTPQRITDCAEELAAADVVIMIIGPEGGVSPEELDSFTSAGARSVLLGPEVLRTATASAVALGALGVLTSRW